MSSGLVVIFISQLYHQDLRGRYFDSAARFLLAVPILLALRHASVKSTFSDSVCRFPWGDCRIDGGIAGRSDGQVQRINLFYEPHTSGRHGFIAGFLISIQHRLDSRKIILPSNC